MVCMSFIHTFQYRKQKSQRAAPFKKSKLHSRIHAQIVYFIAYFIPVIYGFDINYTICMVLDSSKFLQIYDNDEMSTVLM